MGTVAGPLISFYAATLLLLLGVSLCHGGEHGAPGRATLSREFLLSLRTSAAGEISASIPREICKPIVRTRKRGKRGGLRRRIKTLRLSDRRKLPPLPTVLLANVQSIRNKLNEPEVWAKLKREIKETCLLAFTETWLSDSDRNEDFSLSGFGIPIRQDQSPEITRKSRVGGVCFYVNERYCNTVKVRERICTTDLELLMISLRPFYLPREFQQLFYTLVYIHPRASATAAAQLIADVMSRLDVVCSDTPTFVLGILTIAN